jgi:RimJ/RimL family protein N-acetyltransferase
MNVGTNQLRPSLAPVLRDDLPYLQMWFNDPAAMGEYDSIASHSDSRMNFKFDFGSFSQARIIHFDQKRIGFCGYVVHPWEDWIAVIGVTIALSEYRGRGLGVSIHQSLMKEVFEVAPKIQKIEALTDVENFPEQIVLSRAGFKKEGLHLRKNRLRGEFRDMYHYGFLRGQEFKPQS